MNVLPNSKSRTRRDATYKEHYQRQVRKRKFLFKNTLPLGRATLETKENDTLRDEIYFFKLRNKKAKKSASVCRKKFERGSNLDTNRTTIIIKGDFVVKDALRLNPSKKPFDKDMFVDKNKNDVDQIFECIKSESVNDDLKMKIKKCQKKTKRKEGLSDKSCTTYDNNKVPKHATTFSNNKNRGQKVVNKILKRKRQTCRKQFRHKDITLYKLGIDNNNKGSSPKKEVIQKIFQKRSSHTSLPAMHYSGSNCTSEQIIRETDENEIVNNSENRTGSAANVGCLELGQESLSRIHTNDVELHQNNDLNTKTHESTHIKRGSSNYSIASLTSESTGKHNLPIRIPEKRSSIAEPLHAFSPYLRPQNDQSQPTTSLKLINDLYQTTTTTIQSTNVSESKIDSPPINIDKQSDAPNQNIRKSDYVKEDSVPVVNSFNVDEKTGYVPTPTITHGSTILNKDGIEFSNNNSNNTFNSKHPVKRKSLHSENLENNKVKVHTNPAVCVQNFLESVSNVNTTHTYPQHNFYSEAISRPQCPQPVIPIYVPYRQQTTLLPPFVFDYEYVNRLHFNPVQYNSIIDKKVENQMYSSIQEFPYQPEPQIEKLPSPKLPSHAQQAVLKNEEPNDFPKCANPEANPKQEHFGELNTTATLSVRNDVLPSLNGDTLKPAVNITSPVLVSDCDNENVECKPAALNLATFQKSSDLKNSLTLTSPKNGNKVLSSTQTLVMKSLSTLTYVVNEIIEKSGNNMPKQDKEILHKMLENVCESEKMCDVVIKQEDVVDLISSDSELSNDSNSALLTDSNGTLDLSMKTFCGGIKPQSLGSTKTNEADKDSNRIVKEKSPEDSVLNLTTKSTFRQNDDNSAINLSMRDRKDQLIVSKEKSTVSLTPSTGFEIKTSKREPTNVDLKTITQTTDIAQKQSLSLTSNELVQSNVSSLRPAHSKVTRVDLESEPNRMHSNGLIRERTNHVLQRSDKVDVHSSYDESQRTVWNERNQVDYLNPNFQTNTYTPLTTSIPNHVNSINTTYPPLTNATPNVVNSTYTHFPNSKLNDNSTYPLLTNPKQNDANSINSTYPLLTNPKQNDANSINSTYPHLTISKTNAANSIISTYSPLTSSVPNHANSTYPHLSKPTAFNSINPTYPALTSSVPNHVNSINSSYPPLTNPNQNNINSINSTYPHLTNFKTTVVNSINPPYPQFTSSIPNHVNSINSTNPHFTNPKQNDINSYPHLTNSKPNDVNSVNVTFAPNHPAWSTSDTVSRLDSSAKDKNVLNQHKTNFYAKQKVDKGTKERLQKKHNNQGHSKTSHSYYASTAKPSTTTTQPLMSATFTETSQFSRPTTNQHDYNYNNNSHIPHRADIFSESSRAPQSFLQYRDKKYNSAWNNNQKCFGESTYSSNSKNHNSEAHANNHTISPDYGYFSPLSKFAPNIENTQITNANHTYSLFSQSLASLISTNVNVTQDNSQPCSPILHRHDRERLLNILPKLNTEHTLTPEEYVMEVDVLETNGCPKPFLDFYNYITKKQISINLTPVSFRIFLEFQNAGQLKEFERGFRIYSQKHENEKHA
ncbi:hypothetical protein FQR65_LT10557 [Abscondita terminalis]|nr:hypothetical protein FQR65_LT10557 [Abscondita terminalis]